MKKTLSILITLLITALSLSSCMKVNITLPQQNIGAGQAPAVSTTAEQLITLPPVVAETTAPAIETTSPAVEETKPQEITTEPAAQKTPLEMTDEELLTWFNTSLNNVKEGMPAFERAKLTTVSDIVLSNQLANTLVGFVKGALLSEETEIKTAEKGQSCVEIMSPDGERYVSNLDISDIKDIKADAKGTSYEVTVTMPDAKNPDRNSGAYAKIFNFITVDDVVSTYAPKVGATVERKDIEVNYSGCYAKALISPDGKIEAYDTYVTCVMSLKNASIKKGVTISTDVDITLESNTNFTKFAY